MLLELGRNYFLIYADLFVEFGSKSLEQNQPEGFQNIRTFLGCAKLVSIEN
jgi:hypothetical protein